MTPSGLAQPSEDDHPSICAEPTEGHAPRQPHPATATTGPCPLPQWGSLEQAGCLPALTLSPPGPKCSNAEAESPPLGPRPREQICREQRTEQRPSPDVAASVPASASCPPDHPPLPTRQSQRASCHLQPAGGTGGSGKQRWAVDSASPFPATPLQLGATTGCPPCQMLCGLLWLPPRFEGAKLCSQDSDQHTGPDLPPELQSQDQLPTGHGHRWLPIGWCEPPRGSAHQGTPDLNGDGRKQPADTCLVSFPHPTEPQANHILTCTPSLHGHLPAGPRPTGHSSYFVALPTPT